MRATRLAVVVGVVVLAATGFLAAIGVTAVSEALVTVVALTALVGGGNWIAGRTTRGGRPPTGARRPAPAGLTTCPMARWAPVPSGDRASRSAGRGETSAASAAPTRAVHVSRGETPPGPTGAP